MNSAISIGKQVLVALLKIGGALALFYVFVLLIMYVGGSLGEMKKYAHCNTYDGFVKTANARNIPPDGFRLLDVRAVQIRLSGHYVSNDSYPIITSGSASERWTALQEILEIEEAAKRYDPCMDRNPDYQYSYGSNETGTDYVLRAVMEDGTHYESAILGEVYGIWCGDSNNSREYCVGPLIE